MIQIFAVLAAILFGLLVLALVLGLVLVFIFFWARLSKLRMLLTHLTELAGWFDRAADGLEFASNVAVTAAGVVGTGGRVLKDAGNKLEGISLPEVLTSDKTLSLYSPDGPFPRPNDVIAPNGDVVWSAPDAFVLKTISLGSSRVFENTETPLTTAGLQLEETAKKLGTTNSTPDSLAKHFADAARANREIAKILRDISL